MATIAIDLDGVVYDYQRTYRYMMREYRNLHLPPIEEFWLTWDAPKKYVLKTDSDWMWNEGVKRGLFRYGHMITGARMGIQALAEAGHDLCIVTHRPVNAQNDTREWITFFFKDIPLSGIHILSDGQPKTNVLADILVDDKPENVLQWFDAGRSAIIFDRPYNRGLVGVGRLRRAMDWKEVPDLVSQMQ